MRKLATFLAVLLAVSWRGSDMAPAATAERLIAVDVLLLPDANMVRRVTAINRQLLRESPGGFALDATHVPHMTLLQCYVERTDLPAVEAAVADVFRRNPPEGMSLTAIGLFDSAVGPVDATGILARPTPRLTTLQHDVVAAVTPFIRHGAAADAFVDAPESPTIEWTIGYVEHFLTNSSGPKYSPHVTAGAAAPQAVARLQSVPFETFRFSIKGAAIYQLGDIGTARRQVWRRHS